MSIVKFKSYFQPWLLIALLSFSTSDGGSSTVSKRLSPADKLKETLLSFEKSLDMLLVDLGKEDLAGDDDEEMEQKTEHLEDDACEAGPSKQ